MKRLAISLSVMAMVAILMMGCSSRPRRHPSGEAASNGHQRIFKETPLAERELFLEFDTYPVAIESARPRYPEAAKKKGFTGTVIVMTVIDETGRVISAWVSESDDPILNAAAIQAAYRFRFKPAKSKGVPVKASISIPFRFAWAG
jgi:TonB family protein